ncbi:hypothetical protein [Anabaena catenula]|uniref:DUF1269 domain-containing protein n=1 Tax=Anabaena catenula FACHB-362 TaxID=2692877 RepID=A0ABR8JBP5_9NOST|nr:hypothetical protein [Anabaena catenula]MBD2694316.1 hypothetical protein [Anabaena catenula FACHB-362]
MSQIDSLTEKLAEFDDNQLMLHLGMCAEGISEDIEGQTRSASLDSIDLNLYQITRGNVDTMNFGQRLFKRLNAASYELLCKDPFDDGETLKKLNEALKDSTAKAAGFLAPVLVANLGLAPAVAAIVATLVIKTFAKTISDEICATWKQNLEASESSTT